MARNDSTIHELESDSGATWVRFILEDNYVVVDVDAPHDNGFTKKMSKEEAREYYRMLRRDEGYRIPA